LEGSCDFCVGHRPGSGWSRSRSASSAGWSQKAREDIRVVKFAAF
jgi:hypothetical protein